MIAIVTEHLRDFCLQLNVKKSKVMVFGRSHADTDMAPLKISNLPVDFVSEWSYLGVTIVSGKTMGFSARPALSSFYRAANSILGTLKGAHEHVLLNLLYTNCVPILTYACAVKEYTNSEMSDCNLAINNGFRKIFGFSHWQSIRQLRETFGIKSLYVIFKEAQDKFIHSCPSHPNPIVRFISRLT